MVIKPTSAFLTAGCAGLISLAALAAAAADTDDSHSDEEAIELEFRSLVVLGDETFYSLYDPEDESSFWISDGEIRNGIEVVEFRSEGNVLSLYLGDTLQELTLSPSRVAEISEAEPERTGNRRERRERRREEYRNFRDQWREATGNSPELDELNAELESLASEFRDIRSARRQAERGTDERRELRQQERAMGREMRLLAEYSVLQASQNSSLENDQSVERMSRMVRHMAFRSSRN